MARENKRKRDEKRFGRPERLIDMLSDPRFKWRMPTYMNHEPRENHLEFAARNKELVAIADRATVISIDNVSEYFFQVSDQDEWDVTTDFPCCAPPAEIFWMEARAPKTIRVGDKVLQPAGGFEQFGMLCRSCKLPDQPKSEAEIIEGSRKRSEQLEAFFSPQAVRQIVEKLGVDAVERSMHPETFKLFKEWVYHQRVISKGVPQAVKEMIGKSGFGLTMDLFLRLGDMMMGPLICFSLTLDRSGVPMAVPNIGFYGVQSVAGFAEGRELSRALYSFMNVSLLALTFMNCKDAKLEVIEPSDRLNRERVKSGRKPLHRSHTIEIDGLKRLLETVGQIESSGLKLALHFCRSHFKTWKTSFFGRTLDKPVTHWIPPHVRGNPERGVVVSDYNVKPPKP
jgi:hypothetical protein